MRLLEIGTVIAIAIGFIGCSDKESDIKSLREEARIVNGIHSEPHPSSAISYELELRRAKAFASLIETLELEMNGLRKSVLLEKRGYYTSDEHDKVVGLLYRYLIARESLWDMIERHSKQIDGEDSMGEIRSTLVALYAAGLTRDASSTMVSLFMDNEAVVTKLNESHHDLGIPGDTFQKVFMSLTSQDARNAFAVAYETYRKTKDDAGSDLNAIISREPEFQAIAIAIPYHYERSLEKIETILDRSSILLPGARNQLRHTGLAKEASSKWAAIRSNLYAIRGKISDSFTGLKSPLAETARLSAAEKAKLKAELRPGDILLTYTEGYLSNVFLPGMFKHGITYIGTLEQRKALGMDSFDVSHLAQVKQEAFHQATNKAFLEDGETADLIEAVAEGVIFNSLDHVLDTHMNRVLILRPNLSKEETQSQLARALLLVGDDYDFNFDFTSGSHQCCTEVIYRSLHGKGNVSFELVKRFGLQTLAADDIIAGFMSNPDQSFSFVAFAEETDSQSNAARVYTNQSGFEFFAKKWREK